MDLVSTVKIAYIGLKSKKTRTFLTMLGIIIGVFSVIMIMSVGAGVQSLILNQIKGLGSNLITIFPGASEEDGPPPSAMGMVNTDLKIDDVEAILKNNSVPNAVAVTYYVRGAETMQWRENKFNGSFVGTTASYLDVHDTEVEFGRFFSEDEEKDLARVVVLGPDVKEELFGDQDPINQTIKIKKEQFKVIGVMEKRGTVIFENQDNLVFIPISTAQKIMMGVDYLSMARVKIDSEINTQQSMDDITMLLRDRHNLEKNDVNDFTVRAMAQAIDIVSSITDFLTLFLALVASVSLLVGGIGIMNIMMIAVTERTREVGLRKALGAKNRNILYQFLVESIVVTFSGGAIGIVLGVSFSFLISKVAILLGYNWDFVIKLSSIIVSTGISVIVGVVFGFYPALKASKLDPITALRYE